MLINAETEICRLKEKLSALEKENDQLNEIIAVLPGHIYWKDRQGMLLGCNDEQAKDSSLKSRFDVVGLTAIDLVPSFVSGTSRLKEAERIKKADQEIMQKNQSVILKEPSAFESGKEVMYLSKKAPLHNKQGEVIGLVGTTLDISSIVSEYEDLLQDANKNKSRFILDISRLIRSPLSLINGAIGLLGETSLSLEQQEYISLIEAGAQKLIPLLNRFHDYVDLEDETLQVCLKKFQPREYFQRFVKEYRQLAEVKQLGFDFHYDEQIPAWLKGGTHFLSQVLDNVLSNALRYTATGDISMQLKLVDDKLVIAIKDTGQGIRAELLPRLFTLFDRTNNVDFTTCGLDLSISYKMMEVLGGDIKIDSEIGKGSCFTILFPIEATTAETRPTYDYYSTYMPARKTPHWIKAKDSLIKIFILEDEPLAHKVLQHMLNSEYNCEIVSAFSVNDAKQKLKTKHDLVLTDMSLPDGTGLDFVKHYHEQYGNDTPIVAITAHVSEEEKEQITDQGVKDIIAKPINLTMIKTIVDFYVLQGGFVEED